MRVRAKQYIRLYWNYGIQELEKGTEAIGDLARHLVDNAPPDSVEVLEEDPEPEGQEDDEDDGGLSPTPPADVDGDGVPDGTIADLMEWVGDDPTRRTQALAAEQAKDSPRATVLKRLGGE